ncbi:MAG: hypothetical protein E7668_06595 [Ruminococcaceae bacterium]|nr:hypothetical protein [Oscillospiraceae bacterium]
MNGRNRHLQYRKSVYRRRKLRTILITVGVLLVVLLVAFLVIGNLLQNKSEERAETDTKEQTLPPISEERTPHREIVAYSVLLETLDEGSFADRVAALPDGDSAVSIPLTDREGTPLYRSPIALRLGLQSEGAYTVTVASALSSIGERYTSGVFYLTALSEEDALLRSVRLSQSAAMLAEAAEGGLDEALLTVPDMTEEQVQEAIYFAEQVRHLAPELELGLTLSETIYSSENAAAVIDRLYESFDFLAIEAVPSNEGDPVAQTAQTIHDLRYHLLRYHMRLLLPVSDDATQAALIEAVEKEGFHNWQFVH